MTPKNIHKLFIPQEIFIFLKSQKNIENQDFEPPKMVQAYLYGKISEYPPWVQMSLHICGVSKYILNPCPAEPGVILFFVFFLNH